MVELTTNESRPELGRGRSGIVYAKEDGDGRQLACKVFDSRGLTKVVQWLTLGAPNPYVWNEEAARCCKLRRNILKALVPVWTDGAVDVADAVAVFRNEEHKTFELQTQLIKGWAAHLHHPLSDAYRGEAENLWKNVMPSLRQHLQSAGFDGLLWQAGEGNPVALNNFLFEPDDAEAQTQQGPNSGGGWVWIDLESGVPAIFPASLRVFFDYSIRHWRRLGRPMFDDVDTEQLKSYLSVNAEQLTLSLGGKYYNAVVADVLRLVELQAEWKALGRLQSSVGYRLARGDIDDTQAAYYLKHPLLWFAQEAKRGSLTSLGAVKRGVSRVWARMSQIDFAALARQAWRFMVSHSFREEFIHRHIRGSIEKWERRGQLTGGDAQRLRTQLGSPDASVYVADFGIHIAIKPIVKVVQYWILPALFAVGLLSGATVAILILTGGALARSAYTLWRLLQAAAKGYEKPWIALVVGVMPIVGNLAYPFQMVYSSSGTDERLARFMIDDTFARIGRHLPIWGGEDTWTEHYWNRVPMWVNPFFKKFRAPKRVSAA